MTAVPDHFRERVAQRIGADICPVALWLEIQRALKTGADDHVRYLCRGLEDRTWYRFRIEGRGAFAIGISKLGIPITVLSEGMVIARPGKRKSRKIGRAA